MNQIISRKEAKEQGLKYYFTGQPCKRGHIGKRLISTHACVKCRNEAYKYDPTKPKHKNSPGSYSIATPLKTLLRNAKIRANKHNLPFNITEHDLEIPEYCPVFGFKLIYSNNTIRARDESASLDKIIPELGYVKGNVIIVSWKANRMKSNASILELQQLSTYYSKFLSLIE